VQLARILVAWVASIAALWVADQLFDGVTFDDWQPLLIAAAVLAVLAGVVRPVLVLLSLPLIVITLGLFLLLINMAVLALTQWLVPGFDISGFWTYVGTVIVTWLVTTIVEAVLPTS
jgi:putative membrane protein